MSQTGQVVSNFLYLLLNRLSPVGQIVQMLLYLNRNFCVPFRITLMAIEHIQSRRSGILLLFICLFFC